MGTAFPRVPPRNDPWHPVDRAIERILSISVLKVVQERSRVSPAIRGRVPLPRIFKIIFDLKMASFDLFLVVFYVIKSYKRVNKRPGIDPANQRVPGLRPWRPGPTLSPAVYRAASQSRHSSLNADLNVLPCAQHMRSAHAHTVHTSAPQRRRCALICLCLSPSMQY